MKLSHITAAVLLSALVSTTALAQDGGSSAPRVLAKDVLAETPACQNLMSACKDAGFRVGQEQEENGVFKNCFGPLITGKGKPNRKGRTVKVRVSADDVETCNAALAATRPQPPHQ